MALHRRSYSGESDKQQMSLLAHASNLDNLHLMDLPYRFSSWAFDLPENVALWFDETERLTAWAVMQTPMWVIDYAHLSTIDTADIHTRILSWADAHARAIVDTPDGHPMWFANVREDQHRRITALQEAGFACQANVDQNPWRKAFLKRSVLSPISPYPTPLGVTLRPLEGQEEVEAYVKLHRSAFGSKSMTHEWRHRVLQRPEYIPDLDLVAVTADGTLVAFCVGWFSAQGMEGRPCGQIEPMGVHEDFQRKGLGRAILLEVLRRLQGYGAEQVYVEADENSDGAFAFYRSLGFEIAHGILVYRKDYSGNR